MAAIAEERRRKTRRASRRWIGHRETLLVRQTTTYKRRGSYIFDMLRITTYIRFAKLVKPSSVQLQTKKGLFWIFRTKKCRLRHIMRGTYIYYLSATIELTDIKSDPDELQIRARMSLEECIAGAQQKEKEQRKMTSERQKAANRANARHSTGPKTSEGKAAIRLNALRHGLLTRDVALPGEDAELFEELFNQVRAHLSPVGPIEEFLVDRVVNAMWRLRRLERAETALFHSRIHGLKADQLAKLVSSYEKSVLHFLQHPPDITDQAAHTEATEALERAKYEQDRDEVLLGRASDADAKEGDTFDKLARYEGSLERSLHRALDQLYRIQDRRRKRPSARILDAITLDAESTE
jgi:hypothetical protein